MEKVMGSVGEVFFGREAVIRALGNCYDPCCRDRMISVVDIRDAAHDGMVSFRPRLRKHAADWPTANDDLPACLQKRGYVVLAAGEIQLRRPAPKCDLYY